MKSSIQNGVWLSICLVLIPNYVESNENSLNLVKILRQSHSSFEYITSNESHKKVVKRFLPYLMNVSNKKYQKCKTPSGDEGHCKHIYQCGFSEFRYNFWRFMDFFCMMERSAIGVCCVDDITEKSGSSLLPILDNVEEELNSVSDQQSERIVNRPDERGCGMATKTVPKIKGGRPADPKAWAWMVALLRKGPPKAYCGGVLITNQHVLTAAHCTKNFVISEIFVRLGEYNFSTYNVTNSRDFKVIDIRQHNDFNSTSYENDIAILKMHKTTVFNSYIWPVCMPPSGETWEGYSAIVTGWGTQFFGGPASDVLMEVTLPIWTQKRCKDAFVQHVTDLVICAGSIDGGKDSCQGDSGGPLLVQLPNKRWAVVGIVSWGIHCGEPNYPGIYTRVDAYTPWIFNNVVF